MIQPGEIYWAEFDEAGPHPVIVVSREELNRGGYVLAVFCTSARFALRQSLPSCVPFRAGEYGFGVECVAQCENVLSVEIGRLELSRGPIGVLDEIAMREVIKAIGYVLGSDCEPG